MAREINARLQRLNERRKGMDRIATLSADARADSVAKSFIQEEWQRRAVNRAYTRYTLGAMQSVAPEYTQKSIETAERVGETLSAGMKSAGQPITTRLQGSVALDIHIRGVSDVDILALDSNFITYAMGGVWSQVGRYTSSTPKTSLGVLQSLRGNAEQILQRRYWGANVDCSGSKCITLSGGSLDRLVDIVPSHWYDTIQYQKEWKEHERAVTILDSKNPSTIDNFPFLHINRVNIADEAALGGLKKARGCTS